MANTNLYPPSIEGTLPAYIKGGTLSVPFEHNKTVVESQIKGMYAKIKNIQSDKLLFNSKIKANSFSNNIAKFTLSTEQLQYLNIGMSYKIQLSYATDDTGTTCQYYSTAGIFKVTDTPSIKIDTLKTMARNPAQSSYIGVYSNNDSTEKVNEYKFTIFDSTGEIVETSGWCLNYKNDTDTATTSHNTFTSSYGLSRDETYTIKYYVKTYNDLELVTPGYQILMTSTIEPGINGYLRAEIDDEAYENGYVKLFLTDNVVNPEVSNGTFLLERCQNGQWSTIHKFSLLGQLPSTWSYKDLTVEQGIEYTYAIREYTKTITSNRLMLTDENGYEITITPDFDYMFLYDGERQLKIKFNPKVSSFKTDIPEQKTDTIGSKYAFFTRNSITNYKEFSISGLISYLSDENGLFYDLNKYDNNTRLTWVFTRCTEKLAYKPKRVYYFENKIKAGVDGTLTQEEYEAKPRMYFYYAPSTTVGKFKQCGPLEKYYGARRYYNEDGTLAGNNGHITKETYDAEPTKFYYYLYPHKDTTDNKVDYTKETTLSERLFKLEVLDWLNNGKPKLFRSPVEGNYVVRLMNVSLTPNDTLGRKIHTFNATAYEIADANSTVLASIGVTDNDEPSLMNLHYKTYYLGDNEYTSLSTADDRLTLLNEKLASLTNIKHLELTDLFPGDKFTINGDDFIIGSTGNLYYDEDIDSIQAKSIASWVINSSSDRYTMYGEVTIGYMSEEVESEIVHYDSVTSDRIPCKQWIGKNTDIVHNYNSNHKLIYDANVIEDAKYGLIEIKQALFEKRTVVDIYYLGNNFDGTYPTSFEDYYWDYNGTNQVQSLNKWEIYRIRTKTSEVSTDGLMLGKDYYIDRQLNKYYTIDGHYLDSNWHKVWKQDEYDCSIYFDDEDHRIDLSEYIYFVNHHNAKENEVKPNIIYIGCGVMANITFEYNVKNYSFEKTTEFLDKWNTKVSEKSFNNSTIQKWEEEYVYNSDGIKIPYFRDTAKTTVEYPYEEYIKLVEEYIYGEEDE